MAAFLLYWQEMVCTKRSSPTLKANAGGRSLDIPTGYGAMARKLHGMRFSVFCCDIDLSQFRSEGLIADKGDLNGRIPHGDEEFDYVCFLEDIEHTEDPYNAVREVTRVLKSGGIY